MTKHDHKEKEFDDDCWLENHMVSIKKKGKKLFIEPNNSSPGEEFFGAVIEKFSGIAEGGLHSEANVKVFDKVIRRYYELHADAVYFESTIKDTELPNGKIRSTIKVVFYRKIGNK